MLDYEQALAKILDRTPLAVPRRFALLEALGLVCAEQVNSQVQLPPFANSAMDGFAVRASDLKDGSLSLPLAGEIPAGRLSLQPLQPGTTMRIMTGAPIPAGADSVVPVEDTESHGSRISFVGPIQPGQCVRPAAEDIAISDEIVAPGDLLRPPQIALLAAVGQASIQAYPPPRVAIISTGDELVQPGQPLGPGQIYNSNGYAIAAQAAEAGGTVMQCLHAGDSLQSLREAFDQCAGADVLITSGGVSVGEYDFVKAAAEERGALDFWRVAIRPGKPLAFGHIGNTLFFGLPGNPVSAMVTFELFVRPTLLKMRGFSEVARPTVQAQLAVPATHTPGRRSYQRCYAWQEGDHWQVRPHTQQGSHQMHALLDSNAFLILPHDVTELAAGDFASVMLLT